MAALSVEARTEVWRGLMRWASANREQVPVITKYDLYNPNTNTGAVADTDAWIDGNSGANINVNVGFNNQLATAVRNNLTATQKTVLFIAVAARRVSKQALSQVLSVSVD